MPVSMTATLAGAPGPGSAGREPGDVAGCGPPIPLPIGAVGVMLVTDAVKPRARSSLATSESSCGVISGWVSRTTRPCSSAQSTSPAVHSQGIEIRPCRRVGARLAAAGRPAVVGLCGDQQLAAREQGVEASSMRQEIELGDVHCARGGCAPGSGADSGDGGRTRRRCGRLEPLVPNRRLIATRASSATWRCKRGSGWSGGSDRSAKSPRNGSPLFCSSNGIVSPILLL